MLRKAISRAKVPFHAGLRCFSIYSTNASSRRFGEGFSPRKPESEKASVAKKSNETTYSDKLLRSILDGTAKDMLDDKGTNSGEVVSVLRTDSLRSVATIVSERNIGALIVKEGCGKVAGIISERDVVKAAAKGLNFDVDVTESVMTPFSKLIFVSRTTGLGECMELMRQNQIRHLPVLETGTQLGSNVAEEEARKAAEEERAHAQAVAGLESSFLMAYGTREGSLLFEQTRSSPEDFTDDERPLVRDTAHHAVRLLESQAQAQAAATRAKQAAEQAENAHHLVGILSVKDVLVKITQQYVEPVVAWHLEEERRERIEERVGYSE